MQGYYVPPTPEESSRMNQVMRSALTRGEAPVSRITDEVAAQRSELRHLLEAERDQALRNDDGSGAAVFQRKLDALRAEQQPRNEAGQFTGKPPETDEKFEWGGGVRGKPITPPKTMNSLLREMGDAARFGALAP
jgi:hypothetical protein